MAKHVFRLAVKISAAEAAANDQNLEGKIIKFPAKKKDPVKKGVEAGGEREERDLNALAIYLRQIRSAKYGRMSHDEFNEMAKRLTAYKKDLLEYATEMIRGQDFGEHTQQYAAFVSRFGEPKGRCSSLPWLRERVESRDLSAVFREFNMLAAEQIIERMCNANLALVVSVAKRSKAYRLGLMPLEELIQMGNIGLLESVAKYDYKKGFRFSTYATWWIKHCIERGVDDTSRSIRIPVHVMLNYRKLLGLIRNHKLDIEGDRTGTMRQLVLLAGWKEDKVERTLALAEKFFKVSSLDSVPEGGESSLMGTVADETEERPDRKIEKTEDFKTVITLAKRRLLAGYSAGWEVLCLRFGLEGKEAHTLQEIADIYGLSRERIRQIQERSLRILRPFMERRGYGG